MNGYKPLQACLIDNWTYEQAASLLRVSDCKINISPDNFSLYGELSLEKDRYESSILSLSNVINALIFFDDLYYLKNGYERSWVKSNVFEDYISHMDTSPIEKDKLYIDDESYVELLLNIQTEKKCDIIVSPSRIKLLEKYNFKSSFFIVEDFFKSFNKSILLPVKNISSDVIKNGIIGNLKLPSITNYVLSQSDSASKIIDTAIKLKEDKNVKNIKAVLQKSYNLIASGGSLDSYQNLLKKSQEEIDSSLEKIGLLNVENDRSTTIGINILIFSISYSFPSINKKDSMSLYF